MSTRYALLVGAADPMLDPHYLYRCAVQAKVLHDDQELADECIGFAETLSEIRSLPEAANGQALA